MRLNVAVTHFVLVQCGMAIYNHEKCLEINSVVLMQKSITLQHMTLLK